MHLSRAAWPAIGVVVHPRRTNCPASLRGLFQLSATSTPGAARSGPGRTTAGSCAFTKARPISPNPFPCSREPQHISRIIRHAITNACATIHRDLATPSQPCRRRSVSTSVTSAPPPRSVQISGLFAECAFVLRLCA
jgi:hypothetical protein